MKRGVLFALVAILFWGVSMTTQALLVEPISPEDQLIRSQYAGYFKVLSRTEQVDDNGFNAVVFELACLDPIKGCTPNEIITIKMANPPAFSALRLVPNSLKVNGNCFAFINRPSRLGFSQFVGLKQNSYFKESSAGQVLVPEQLQQKIERTPNGRLQLNLNAEGQPMVLQLTRGRSLAVKDLLEKYRSIKVQGRQP